MDNLLGLTTAYCTQCAAIHPARYEEVSGRVEYVIECPRATERTLVSSDSALFLSLRSRQAVLPEDSEAPRPRWHRYVVPITNRCGWECPVCYAEATAAGHVCLTVDQLRRLALQVKEDGGKRLSLSGGEPTTHPHLLEIVRMVREEVGLAPILVTNGMRLAEDYGYLVRLREAGLRRVHLQFDTLREETCRFLRGRQAVSAKLRAVDHVRAAGLQLGLIATVCSRNLAEASDLVDYARTLVPALKMLAFQPLVPVGRFPADIQAVTREDVLHALARSAGRYDLRESDFVPFCRVRPDIAAPHPDCSAHVVMCVEGKSVYPLPRDFVSHDPAPSAGDDALAGGPLTAGNVPDRILRRIGGARAPKNRRHLFVISVIAFMRPCTRDEERLRRCIVATVTDQGLLSVCARGRDDHTRSFEDG